MKVLLNTKLNTNGQKVLNVKCGNNRAFNVQTAQNLPIAHRCDNNILTNCLTNRARVLVELTQYIRDYGTKVQKESMKWYLMGLSQF